MIKSKVNKGSSPIKAVYPCMKYYAYTGGTGDQYYVVLFDRKNSGMVVYNSKPESALDKMLDQDQIGKYAINWDEDAFDEYNDKVILENLK